MVSAELPRIVPIFPLPGVLLLPRSELPLHIFEPRYRAMTAAALDGGARSIAMIQPSDTTAGGANPPVFSVGCLGEITDVKKAEDGRFFVTLTGRSRFRVQEELPLLDGYRRVVADYSSYPDDLVGERDLAIDRDRVVGALEAYVGAKGLSADWTMVRRLKDEPLVNGLAMLCPFAANEKQALLEAPDIDERSRLLVALLEMATLTPSGTPAARH